MLGLIVFLVMAAVCWLLVEVARTQQQKAHKNPHIKWLLDDDELEQAIQSRLDREQKQEQSKMPD